MPRLPFGLSGFERRPLAIALLLSLSLHALLSSLLLSGRGPGLPGFALPWRERRAEAPPLRVVIAASRPAAATGLRAGSVEGPLRAMPSRRQPLDGGPSSVPRPALASPAPVTVDVATPRLVEPPVGPIDRAAPAIRLAGPAGMAPERSDERVPAATAPVLPKPAPVLAAAPALPDADRALPEPARADDQTRERRGATAKAEAAALDAMERSAREAEERLSERSEAAEVEAVRLEAERVDVVRQAAARQQAAQQAALEEATRREAARVESARSDAERQAAERQAAADLDAARQQAARAEVARLDAERLESARRTELLLQAARDEAARRQAAQTESARLDAERHDVARQAAAARLEAERRDAARLEAERLHGARQAAGRLEAARQEAARDDDRREAARRAMGRQLDAEAARRQAEQPPADTLPTSWSSARRGRLFGRTDANTELVLYAEAWARKIQLNMTLEMVRDAAKRPHAHPMVTVAIRRDGSVESVTFVVSSGVAEIDEAVRRIVRSQAPYQAFPAGLASEFDVVEIRRTWHFDTAVRLD